MSKLQRDVLEAADYMESPLAEYGQLLQGNAVNDHEVLVWETDGDHVVLRSDPREIGPLALQQGKHHSEVSSGDGGYAACMHFLTTDGERIGTLSADVTNDGHNHVGIYTNSGIDGSDSQPIKRLNVQGGSELVSLDAYAVSELRMGPRTHGGSGDGFDLNLEANSGGRIYHNFREGGSTQASLTWRPSWGQLRLYNYVSDSDLRIGDGNGALTARSGGPAGAGAFGLGSNGAKIYVNSNGEVAVMDESGNSTVIS